MLRWLKHVILAGLIALVGVTLYLVIPVKVSPAENIVWGTTFTKSYAEYLGLDWKQTYLAILEDLKIKAVRIGINWNEIEAEQGKFEFADYDWMFDEAEKRGVKILPVIGYKLPRWPECRAPEWALSWLPPGNTFVERMLDIRVGPQRAQFEKAQLAMLQAVVEHFKTRPGIYAWQVENEGFIGWFGDCPAIKNSFVRKEAEFVRALDPRPILMADSGELSVGLYSAFAADMVGTSLYREVWNDTFGFIEYPLPPSFYARKAGLLRPWVSKFMISELQLEAWAPKGILSLPIEEQLNMVSPEKMKARLEYARRTGMDEIYTWGVEWWGYLKLKGYPQLWEVARDEFAK